MIIQITLSLDKTVKNTSDLLMNLIPLCLFECCVVLVPVYGNIPVMVLDLVVFKFRINSFISGVPIVSRLKQELLNWQILIIISYALVLILGVAVLMLFMPRDFAIAAWPFIHLRTVNSLFTAKSCLTISSGIIFTFWIIAQSHLLFSLYPPNTTLTLFCWDIDFKHLWSNFHALCT